MTDTAELADRFWDLHRSNDHAVALWEGYLEHLEQWPDVTTEGVEAYRSGLLEIADAADALAISDELQERITANTTGRAAFAEAATLEMQAEIEAHNPVVGAFGLVETFLPRYTLVTEEHGRRYLDKLHNAPGFFDALGDALARGATQGATLVDVHVLEMIAILDDALVRDVLDDPLGSQPEPKEGVSWDWESSVREVLAEEIRPAIARYRDALREVALGVARSTDQPGICHVPGGEETYARKIVGFTMSDLTPEEVHRIGLGEIERLEEEYRAIGSEAFGTTDLAQIRGRIRDDDSLHYHDTDRLISDATEMFERARATAPSYFRVTPDSDCEVRPSTSGAMAFYSGPDPEIGKPAAFYFNVKDPAAWGPQLAATTFHEGIPGHHFDMARSVENTEMLDIHRRMYVAAFNEGWALYSERVSDEMGLYRDPIERLGMLMGDSLRAARLVVDTGMHALGWTRDQAIGYMVDNTPLPVAEIVPEIDRYIGNPGQACAYMIGRLAIEEARRDAESRLGDTFDVADFHEAVLVNGTVSLDAMRWSVDDWVASS